MGDQERAERAAEQTAQRVARTFRRIRDDARQARSPGFMPPLVDADPPADDPTTVWMFADGRMRNRLPDGTVVEHRPAGYAGSTETPTSDVPKPPDPEVVERTRTYSATWGRTLCPVHGVHTGPSLSYGRWSATHGQRKVMLGLNDSQIRDDLGGATIRSVHLRFRNDWSFAHSGIQIRLGGHNKSSPPGQYSSEREAVFSGHWPKSGGDSWRKAPRWFGEALRDGKIRGLTINQRTDVIDYYGAMAWGTFKIRVTYSVEV